MIPSVKSCTQKKTQIRCNIIWKAPFMSNNKTFSFHQRKSYGLFEEQPSLSQPPKMGWTSRIKSHSVAVHDGSCLGFMSACTLLGIRCQILINGWGEAERGKLPLGLVLAPNKTSRGKVGLFKENRSSEDGEKSLLMQGEGTGCLSVAYWCHTITSRFVGKGEKASCGPRRDRLGSAAAQLLKSLQPRTPSTGRVFFTGERKEIMQLSFCCKKNMFQSLQSLLVLVEKHSLRKESSLRPLSESMPWHTENSLPA